MKQLVFILFTFCVISNSYAQMDCESIPSCEELGYTQESCSGGKGVRCPFDESKFYCAGAKQLPDAPDPVITPEDWTAECADKINYCTAYNNDCQCTACESGYLLSDGACVPECSGSNKCKDSSGNCVTCYSSCSEYNNNYANYTDTEPTGYTCSSIMLRIGAGNGATSALKACYYNCTKDCNLDTVTCATENKTFNSVKCTCEACPTNYQFNSETKACEQIACDITKVEHCATYSSDYEPCECTACETNYLLVDGVCKKMCTVVDNCTAYDSEYDPCNCTVCEDGYELSDGACVPACDKSVDICATESKTFNSETCTCEACPNNQTFDEEGKFCRTCGGKQKEGTCAVGENFIEWSKYEDGTACGDCVNCLDETDQNNPCVKDGIYKYTCQGGGRYPIGESKCECGTVPYYTKCGVEEQCFENYETKKENGGSCTYKRLEDSTYITMSGYYPVRYDCTRNTDAKKVYWLAKCDTAKDCDGNPGPAYGLKTCDEGTGIGEPVMCGGKEWYESCDPCQEESSVSANGGKCWEAALEGSYYDDANGMYRAGEKCTRADGKKIYYIAKCNIEKDCLGNPGPVAGLQDCSSIFSGEGLGDPVECRGKNFYESCDTCASYGVEENTDNGGLCNIYTAEGSAYDNDYGYYRVKEKCTQTTGKKVYWVTKCNVAKDCAGNVPEAAGLKECGSKEFGYGKVVKCSGKIYADKCLTECNYEKTEADCTSEGKSFVLKCVDNKNQSWGECS